MQSNITRARGFTLIELLMVISIIGILSGIAMVSLGGARVRAQDAKVSATMANLRTAAEIYYTGNGIGGYGPATSESECASGLFASSEVKPVIDSVAGPKYCRGTIYGYVAVAALPGGGAWCVDQTGTSTRKTTVPTATTSPTVTTCAY
jgi:prepilin-type N-terminal cleavage/methylation domain-containing protein